METAIIILNIINFFKILLLGIGVVAFLGVFVYFNFFKYIVELNKKSGSGVIIVRKRARKVKSKSGNFKLVTIKGKAYLYPRDNRFIYQCGRSFLIRFYEKAENDYHPMEYKLSEEKKNQSGFLNTIPQNIKFLYKSDQEDIRKKYEERKTVVQQYGPIISLGAVALAFIMATWFITEQLGAAIDLGNTVISHTAQCIQTISQAPPP